MSFFSRKKTLPFFILVVLLLLTSFFIFNFLNKKSQKEKSAAVKGEITLRLPEIKPAPKIKEKAKAPLINSKSYALIDGGTNYLLLEKNGFDFLPIASLSKMMTALVVMDLFKLDEMVEVNKEAIAVIGSKIGLKNNEKFSVFDLLQGLLINSGNDAAYALALRSGSLARFVDLMNQKAKNLGLKNSVFKDPAGLDDTAGSTAFDLGILARELLKNEMLVSITSKAEAEIVSNYGLKYQLKNSNRLVTEEMPFSGAIGLKTGFTPTAGHSLVAAAKREEHTLIAVILSTYEFTNTASAAEAKKLLEWGFKNVEW
ncbi:D-alanyl-D-alanine carboxypeptidase [Candidatus Berkelbacteria bacterium]|nr:D-alanyl-D-alanine carboxypeptidase [Candidatus Berkelbacteria bacterium]